MSLVSIPRPRLRTSSSSSSDSGRKRSQQTSKYYWSNKHLTTDEFFRTSIGKEFQELEIYQKYSRYLRESGIIQRQQFKPVVNLSSDEGNFTGSRTPWQPNNNHIKATSNWGSAVGSQAVASWTQSDGHRVTESWVTGEITVELSVRSRTDRCMLTIWYLTSNKLYWYLI